jgi:pimeloyl-ACP methyl ester carboxylesterase
MACTTKVLAVDHIMFTPLDTTQLPIIKESRTGGDIVRTALAGNMMWKNTYANLVRNNFSAKSVKQVMDLLFNTTHRHMVSISCAYWSENVNGDSLLVSGKIYLPKNRNLRGIVVVNHYTITTNYEAPSNLFQMDCIYAMKDYAVVMPDYEGYGLSADEQHPYLHWRSAAKTAIDLLDCMPDILDYYGYTYPNDVVITGYSQGGAVALGVARMLEEEPSDRWTIRKLYAGAGPYDPAATYDYCVERDSMGIPGAIPMIVMGMSAAYDLNFQLEDFFLEPLLSNYDEWVVSKQYTVSQIGELMGSTRMTELMLPQALDRQNELTELLYNALKENSNVGYNLQSPAYFMHSIDDDIVPIINSLELQQQMPDSSNVVYDFGHYGTHMGGAVLFTKYVYQDL